MEESIQILL